MVKLKKFIGLTVSLVMMSSLVLTGCGSKTEEKVSQPKTEAETKVKKEKPVNLVWYNIGTPQKDNAMVVDELNKYLLEKINATIDLKYIDWGDYSNKMQIAINSGEEFDITFTCSWANDYLSNVRKGAFVPMDDLLDTYGKETKEVVDARFWKGAQVDNKIYAIPTNKELGIAPMWVFTKEYVDKYNVPYQDIHTLEDLQPWLELIKEKEPDVVPLYMAKDFRAPAHFDYLLSTVGVSLLNDDLKVESIYENDEYIANLKTLREFYLNGYINKDASTTSSKKEIKRFVFKADGQPFAENLWGKDLGYEVVASPVMDSIVTNGSATGAMQAISATSKHPEKAMEFLNLLNTDPYVRNTLNNGLEGVHFERVEDNKIKVLPGRDNFAVPSFTLGNLFILDIDENDPANKWEVFQEFNDASVVSPALGFKFNPDPVMTEIAGISNIENEFKSALSTGSVDPEEYLEKVNAKLQSTGIDKVIEEMQKQLDEWKKVN